MVKKYLSDKGIRIIKINGNEAKIECPKCRHTEFSINLENGTYKCFRAKNCGIEGNFIDFKKLHGDDPFHNINKKEIDFKIKYQDINSEINEYFAKRGISEKTLKYFPVGYDNGIVFLYKKEGKLVGAKYRNLEFEKEKRKFWKKEGSKSVLFNQDNIKSKELIICEGEIDCISLKEYGLDAVSIPSGVEDLGWIANDFDFLEKFEKIYLCFDNDEAGKKNIPEIIKRLGEYRCYTVNLPLKDVNECLMNFITPEQMAGYFADAECMEIQELAFCDRFTDRIIFKKNNPYLLKGALCGTTGLTNILKGWRPSELTVWTGFSGSGKSTYLSQEVIHLLKQGKKVCIGSFEMSPDRYLWWMINQYYGYTETQISDAECESFLNQYAESLFIIDLTGTIEKELLFRVMKFAYHKYGVDTFIVDSLMCVDLTTESFKYFGEQKKLVKELKGFAERTNSHIHLVAHPRKPLDDEQFAGKSDVSGAGEITNLADNVITVHRFTEKQKQNSQSDKKYDVALIVKKNREHGDEGQIGFYYDKRCRRFESEPIVYINNNYYNREE